MILNYANFKDRTSRSDYWWATLGVFLLALVLGFVFGLLGVVGSFLSWLLDIALFVPELAMSVRRMHDIGKSGWWLLIGFIPLVGGIILLIWACKAGDPGDNIYGSDPNSSYGY